MTNYAKKKWWSALMAQIAGWDVSVASYDSKSFNMSAQASNIRNVFFRPDGTKMYAISETTDTVYQYNLSTPWDVSTASYDSKSFSAATQSTSQIAIFFRPDGTKMYVVSTALNAPMYQYSLSTPWDVSTASYDSKSFNTAASSPRSIFFRDDGIKMYVVGDSGNYIAGYTLSTPWDISTASIDNTFSLATQDTSPWGSFFRPDGSKMYIMGSSTDTVYQYSLSTPWDVSTASYDSKSFITTSQDPNMRSIFFRPDGTKMYTTSDSSIVYQYSL